jgi:CheY-like chemotaxis protein
MVIMDAPLKILAVDNEPTITLSMRFVFNGPGYELTCVSDGKTALAKLDANSNLFDVIIVDHKMPGMSGVELVKAARARGIGGKIIVVSAHLTSEAFQRRRASRCRRRRRRLIGIPRPRCKPD